MVTELAEVSTPPPRPRACSVAPSRQCEFGALEPFPDRSGLVGEVGLTRCRHCGVGVSYPPLADVAFLYADRSSQDFQQAGGSLTHTIKRIAFSRQARALLRQIGGEPRRVIDFGCGSGLFTQRLAEALPQATVTGVDFHEQPPPDLAGRSYRSLARVADLAGSADLVLAMHVLEHDDDSTALLNRIARLVEPGGRLVMEVPNIDCVWAPVFGRFWDAWYLPYHRVHFSRASLRGLIEASGMKVELETSACVPTMGRTLANLSGRRNSALFILLGAALHPIQWLIEHLSGRPSALRIVARIPRA
jgi:SAM-dependent methyltransferase